MMAVDPGGSTHVRTERSLCSENILVLDIFFEALNYETIEQKKAYEVAALLGKSKRLLHKFPHLMGGEREGVAGGQQAGRSSSPPPDKSSSMPVIVPSILVRLLPQNAKTSSVVQVLGQFMHSLPQFPHQHREAVGGRSLRAFPELPSWIPWFSAPRLVSESWGGAGRKSCQVPGRPSCGGSQVEPPWKAELLH